MKMDCSILWLLMVWMVRLDCEEVQSILFNFLLGIKFILISSAEMLCHTPEPQTTL